MNTKIKHAHTVKGIYPDDNLVRECLSLDMLFDKLLTDEIRVLDATIRPVDVRMDVIMNRNSDPSVVKNNVNAAVDDFFDYTSRDLGDPFYRSKLISLINDIDGVQWVNLYEPTNNILRVDGGTDNQNTLAFNELIVLGQKNISFYFES